jgi:hypothetical protein
VAVVVVGGGEQQQEEEYRPEMQNVGGYNSEAKQEKSNLNARRDACLV